VETLDLVVTGAEWGEGRRANLLGTFEVSVATGPAEDGSAASGEYAPVGKVATGFTDEALERLTERLEPAISETDGQTVTVEPTTVLEVGYEEIQTSPEYDAGYALRFPRFLGVRDDLGVADADTRDRVERLADEQ
jgi:DNA ligase-1